MNRKIKKVYESPLIPKEHADIYKRDSEKFIKDAEKETEEIKKEIRSNLSSMDGFSRLAIS